MRSLFSAEMKNARVQRWVIILDEYGCNIEYRKGSANMPADMLSRVPISKSVEVIDNSKWPKQRELETDDPSDPNDSDSVIEIKPDWEKNIKALQQEDLELTHIIASI